jgi:two-component system response regulator WspF
MKIGIVNDMPLVIEMIRRTLALDSRHEVIWTAHNGMEAVTYCARQTPDLVLMDLFMPGMGGIEATRRIMAATPCAILIVTINVGTNAAEVFEAMGYGALDAIDTPQLTGNKTRIMGAAFLNKLDAIERLLQERGQAQRHPIDHGRPQLPTAASKLVAVGASAGGPAALSTLLRRLPSDFPAAIVIVQHVDARFAPGMAEWLQQHSSLPVRLIDEGDALLAGHVLFASTNGHVVLKDPTHLGYVDEPKEYVYRPSVDVFFDSVSKRWPGRAVGVLLTGMGRDGAAGLKALRDKGHHTIAQDRATSAVYGMPKGIQASLILSVPITCNACKRNMMRSLCYWWMINQLSEKQSDAPWRTSRIPVFIIAARPKKQCRWRSGFDQPLYCRTWYCPALTD